MAGKAGHGLRDGGLKAGVHRVQTYEYEEGVVIKKLDHIGVAVRNIKAAIETLEQNLGLPGPTPELWEGRGVKMAMLPLRNTQIELLEPTDHRGALAAFLEKSGEGLYHICLGVDSVDQTLSALDSKGVALTEKVGRSVGFARIAFLPTQAANGVAIELMERQQTLPLGPPGAPSLHTVAVAVKDLEVGVGVFRRVLGIEPSEVSREPHSGVRNALFPVGDAFIELVQPADPAGPLARFLARWGEGLYSLAIEVSDFSAHRRVLDARGIAVTEVEMAVGPSRRWGFLSPKSMCGILIGFFQKG